MAARSYYFPNRRDVARFLKFSTLGGLFRALRKDFHQIYLEMLRSIGTKTEFLRALTDWIKEATQNAPTLTTTLRAHAVLIDELLKLISM